MAAERQGHPSRAPAGRRSQGESQRGRSTAATPPRLVACRGAALPVALADACDTKATHFSPETMYHALGLAHEAQAAGELGERYDAFVVDDDALERGLADGSLVEDTRVRDALRVLAGTGEVSADASRRRFAAASGLPRSRSRAPPLSTMSRTPSTSRCTRKRSSCARSGSSTTSSSASLASSMASGIGSFAPCGGRCVEATSCDLQQLADVATARRSPSHGGPQLGGPRWRRAERADRCSLAARRRGRGCRVPRADRSSGSRGRRGPCSRHGLALRRRQLGREQRGEGRRVTRALSSHSVVASPIS